MGQDPFASIQIGDLKPDPLTRFANLPGIKPSLGPWEGFQQREDEGRLSYSRNACDEVGTSHRFLK
jgi:hypothetical protein